MKLRLNTLIFLLFAAQVQAQTDISEYVGVYGDWTLNGEALITKLQLKADGTFLLQTVDYVYPQTFKDFANEGIWTAKDDEITLNPNLKRREPIVQMIERKIGLNDSIEIKVNYYNELYENQELIERRESDFDILTLYLNSKRDYLHLTRERYSSGSCAWAPKIRNRINLDTTNTVRIAKRDIENMGVYTYGFTEFIQLSVENKDSDYFEISVIVPLDMERMPRSKKVIIKGNRAYFYEHNGKVRKSLKPLYKKSS